MDFFSKAGVKANRQFDNGLRFFVVVLLTFLLSYITSDLVTIERYDGLQYKRDALANILAHSVCVFVYLEVKG